jgi:hypothetical protein
MDTLGVGDTSSESVKDKVNRLLRI